MVDDPTGALLTAGSLLFCVTSFALLLGAPLALARALWRWALPRPSKASHSDTEWPLDAAPPHPSDSVDPPAPGPSPFTCSTAAPVCPLTLCLGSWRHELPAHEAFTRAGDARPPHSAQLKVRGVVLRALGAVYLAAFLIVALQARPLIGAHGLSPADRPLGVLEVCPDLCVQGRISLALRSLALALMHVPVSRPALAAPISAILWAPTRDRHREKDRGRGGGSPYLPIPKTEG